MVTTNDRIGYIRRTGKSNGEEGFNFKYIEAKIKTIRIGKNKTSVYSDRFCALDANDLELNTNIMLENSGIVLVGEPFITNVELAERLKKVVDYWNTYGAETVL